MNRVTAARVTGLAIALVIALGIGGCGGRDSTEGQSAPTAPKSPAAEPSTSIPYEGNFAPEEPWWFDTTTTMNAVPSLTLSSDVLFESDSAALSPAAASQLGGVLDLARASSTKPIEISGHSDSDGTDEHNLALSERRAAAVAGWLAARGIAPARLVVSGRGESEPVAPNDSDAHKAANRRVTVSVG